MPQSGPSTGRDAVGGPAVPHPRTDRIGAGRQAERARGVQEGCLEERVRKRATGEKGLAGSVGCCSSPGRVQAPGQR